MAEGWGMTLKKKIALARLLINIVLLSLTFALLYPEWKIFVAIVAASIAHDIDKHVVMKEEQRDA